MGKYKVVVYAICKNEEKNVIAWVNSMKEADEIYVLDTGSTDNTVSLLKKNNVYVFECVINPWRFDIARNKSLDLVPFDVDICVCTDLDESFNPGWREELEKVWKPGITRCRYIYNWSLDKDNNPRVRFILDKIHTRNNYKWIYPVHEVLQSNKEIFTISNKIVLNHYPDISKSRNSYLKLLELSVKENPNNDRNLHYLGREYMYYKKHNKSIDTLIKHINLPTSTWKDEKSASMRFIARGYISLKRYDEAYMWLDKAIKEAPHLRDPLVEKAILCYSLNDFKKVIKLCNSASKIKSHEMTYINETFSWDETIYDLLSIAYFNEKKYYSSYKNVLKAIKINPNNDRLRKNKIIIKKHLQKK